MSSLSWTRSVRSASSYYGACSLLVAGAAAAASGWIPSSSPSTTQAEAAVSNHDTIPLSRLAPMTPIVRLFRPNPNFQIAFDVQTRNPVYALERLVIEDEHTVKVDPGNQEFFDDKSAAMESGHVAPAVDFHFSKIAPQNDKVKAGTWSQLEAHCQQVAQEAWEKDRRQTYVVTGPLWLPRGQLTKNTKVPSLGTDPTHFFKVLLTVDPPDGSDKPVARTVGCFVVVNKEEATNQQDVTKKTLNDCLVPWTDLEAAAGIVFFPGLVNETYKAATGALTMPKA